jgi:uncharacterized membrane protein
MAQLDQTHSESSFYINLERLIFLVDGVFAITLTLLVLDLRLPAIDATNLGAALADLAPLLLVYLIAFYTIANHWLIHQRNFRLVRQVDSRLVWMVFGILLCITLLPASTSIVGQFPLEKLAVACFSVNSFLLALITWISWRYLLGHTALLDVGADLGVVRSVEKIWLYIALGGLVAVVLGFVQVLAAYAIWIVWPYLVSAWWVARLRRQARA